MEAEEHLTTRTSIFLLISRLNFPTNGGGGGVAAKLEGKRTEERKRRFSYSILAQFIRKQSGQLIECWERDGRWLTRRWMTTYGYGRSVSARSTIQDDHDVFGAKRVESKCVYQNRYNEFDFQLQYRKLQPIVGNNITLCLSSLN